MAIQSTGIDPTKIPFWKPNLRARAIHHRPPIFAKRSRINGETFVHEATKTFREQFGFSLREKASWPSVQEVATAIDSQLMNSCVIFYWFEVEYRYYLWVCLKLRPQQVSL
jgi:hypothetical protein